MTEYVAHTTTCLRQKLRPTYCSRLGRPSHVDFPEQRAVSLMRQHRNRFYSNADDTRRIKKGRDFTNSNALAHK